MTLHLKYANLEMTPFNEALVISQILGKFHEKM